VIAFYDRVIQFVKANAGVLSQFCWAKLEPARYFDLSFANNCQPRRPATRSSFNRPPESEAAWQPHLQLSVFELYSVNCVIICTELLSLVTALAAAVLMLHIPASTWAITKQALESRHHHRSSRMRMHRLVLDSTLSWHQTHHLI
jgi:hypothetical protein